MPVYVSMRRQRWKNLRTRYSSGSSCSTATLGSCGRKPSPVGERVHRCCCSCCCGHQCNGETGGLFSVAAAMFAGSGDGQQSKSDAASTLLLWLLVVLQFVVKCIRYFSNQYELTSLAEKNDLYSLLNQCWLEKERSKKAKRSRRVKNRLSKGYFTATTRSEGSSPELRPPEPALCTELPGVLKRKVVVSVPIQLAPFYTSPAAPHVSETNYVTCVFEATGSKVLDVVNDIRAELSLWRQVTGLVTVCCEMSWAVAADQRHVPSERSIQQAVLEHMQHNQRRIDDIATALYHPGGWLTSMPNRTGLAPVLQENCVNKNGTTVGCYRRLYPALLPLVHGDAAVVHEPYWALRVTDQLPLCTSVDRRSTFKLHLICVTLDSPL